MKAKSFLFAALILMVLAPARGFADEPLDFIRLKTDFNLWKVRLDRTDWVKSYSQTLWNGLTVKLPRYLPDDLKEHTSHYLEGRTVRGIDAAEIKDYLEKYVAPEIHRDKQDVTIGLDKEGDVMFDGFAFSGQKIDYKQAAYLVQSAYRQKQEDVRVPVKTIPPAVAVQSDELIDKGITDLLATGETDFSGSPWNRRNNIAVGLGSFNGYLVPPDKEDSVGNILGYVGAGTGYLPELVIKGDKTIPEYGGGLCQVSTTIYRSLLFAGLPITERKNHSYAVSYYDPQGLDATIYPPSPDLRFINDTKGYILFQTITVGDKAYANIYGTPTGRHVDLIGPWYYNYRSALPAKTEYTDKLAPGEKEIVSGSHAGFDASWYRRITFEDEGKEDVLEHIYSKYEARGLVTLIGNTAPSTPSMPSENGT